MDIGPGEIIMILLAVAVLFGAKRIPEIARSLGRAKTEFRKGLEGEPDEPSAPKKPEPGSAQPDEGHGLRPGPDA